MILIVDSGSTKCDWIAVDKDGNQLHEKLRTKGLNPAILPPKKLKRTIKKNKFLKKNRNEVSHVFFYGAGCGTEKPRTLLTDVLEAIFTSAVVDVKEDTMAAIYATISAPTDAAVVCILGTGSNCTYYDGENPVQRVNSLGYTLMDDASGNYYGKKLIRDYYFNHMPETLRVAFESKYNLEDDYIKYNIYKQPNPNAYLASFAEFMILNKEDVYMKALIKEGLREFSKNMIMQFENELKTVPVHFAGSIAFFCKEEIIEVAKEFNYTVGKIERRPIDGLVNFHAKAFKN